MFILTVNFVNFCTTFFTLIRLTANGNPSFYEDISILLTSIKINLVYLHCYYF